MSRPTVLLADDHKIVAEGLKRLLEPTFDLVRTVQDGLALVAAAQELDPDVIVADISMPELNGLEAIRKLRETGLRATIIGTLAVICPAGWGFRRSRISWTT